MMNRAILVLLFLLSALPFSLQAQMPDSIVRKLSGYIEAVQNFGEMLPQEKVYLHFDNTSYYQGDPVWFQCYVVTSELNRPSDLSKTLYVELLNPGGEVIAKRVLPVRNGRCHGSFELTQLPFYSGFYEVRAYTKYMLNFGEEVIFSRVLPVFDKPRAAGDFKEKNIQRYAVYKYPQVRKKTAKEKKVNLKFFPEGGNLVEGIPSRVAFEATDAYGNPIALSGTVINREKKEIASFATVHEGRGTFVYTPTNGENHKAEVELNGKKYRFDLPEARLQGYVLQVDNLSSEDSIAVSVQKNPHTPESVLGLAVLGHGKLLNYCLLNIRKNTPVSFKLDKTEWKAGVAQIVLFDTAGQIIADRLIFMRKPEPLTISVRKNKEDYQPFDALEVNNQMIKNFLEKHARCPYSRISRVFATELMFSLDRIADFAGTDRKRYSFYQFIKLIACIEHSKLSYLYDHILLIMEKHQKGQRILAEELPEDFVTKYPRLLKMSLKNPLCSRTADQQNN